MQGTLYIVRFLTSAKGWDALFLTLILFIFFPHSVCLADDEPAPVPVQTLSGQPAYTPLGQIDNSNRMHLLLNYVREQAPGWAPGLRETLRAPLGWAQSIKNAFGPEDEATDSEDSGGGFIPSFMRSPSAAAGEAMWMTPGYHHKGFLPFHDAMMTGMNFRERAFSDRMQFDFRPFYGQNWTSLNGYGGAELGIGLTRPGEAQPWGRISLRYIDGASYLMDNGRGFDMSAELKFNDDLGLTAGVRSNEETDLGNYVMLRWKLMEFGK